MWHGAVLERTTMPKVHTQVSIHCKNAENKGENIQNAITSSVPLFQRRAKVAGLVHGAAENDGSEALSEVDDLEN